VSEDVSRHSKGVQVRFLPLPLVIITTKHHGVAAKDFPILRYTMHYIEHQRKVENLVRADSQRYANLHPYQRLIDRGDLMTHGVPAIVVQTMREAADRIRYLEYRLGLQSK